MFHAYFRLGYFKLRLDLSRTVRKVVRVVPRRVGARYTGLSREYRRTERILGYIITQEQAKALQVTPNHLINLT